MLRLGTWRKRSFRPSWFNGERGNKRFLGVVMAKGLNEPSSSGPSHTLGQCGMGVKMNRSVRRYAIHTT